MGKKSSDPADVVGAAETEGRYARQTARDKTYADRPDQNTLFGQTRWTQQGVIDPSAGGGGGGGAGGYGGRGGGGGGRGFDGGLGSSDDGRTTRWTQTQTLNPEFQDIFDNQTRQNQGLAQMSADMGGRIQDEMGSAADWGQFGDVVGFDPEANRQAAEDASYGRATNRLDPQFEKRRADLDRQLTGRGLRAGDSAYDSAMQNFGTGRNDAYEQARVGSVSEGRQEFGVNLAANERANALRQQQIQEYIGQRGHSLGEQQALTGAMNTGEMAATYGGGG